MEKTKLFIRKIEEESCAFYKVSGYFLGGIDELQEKKLREIFEKEMRRINFSISIDCNIYDRPKDPELSVPKVFPTSRYFDAYFHNTGNGACLQPLFDLEREINLHQDGVELSADQTKFILDGFPTSLEIEGTTYRTVENNGKQLLLVPISTILIGRIKDDWENHKEEFVALPKS